jgi:hypothetical protein
MATWTHAHGRRTAMLPRDGQLMVSTDLHGNLEDFEALRDRFLARVERGEDVHWALLGDLVHGPDDQARCDEPALYDFDDRSWEVVEGVIGLREAWPGRVHLVLGNHDHGHVGGPVLTKFHADEALHLEGLLDDRRIDSMARLFRSALLLLLAPCGVALCHGSPDDSLRDPAQLDRLSLDPARNDAPGNALLRSILTSYGQPRDVTERVLRNLSRATGLDLGLIVHGHDRDLHGWFVEGGNQLCPVVFGALREHKRFLLLDLAATYRAAADIREGRELLWLHGPRAAGG